MADTVTYHFNSHPALKISFQDFSKANWFETHRFLAQVVNSASQMGGAALGRCDVGGMGVSHYGGRFSVTEMVQKHRSTIRHSVSPLNSPGTYFGWECVSRLAFMLCQAWWQRTWIRMNISLFLSYGNMADFYSRCSYEMMWEHSISRT